MTSIASLQPTFSVLTGLCQLLSLHCAQSVDGGLGELQRGAGGGAAAGLGGGEEEGGGMSC